ncbi:hypothetical protein LZQ00_17635 [Sphingobacterium sp. SRCM116780]|uniref:hypothetical protein n=1 Tax=Sphingobacterium sp. SRCM116780 TaxID=2907623 RepID=UPI001F188808|nr:hypothetical protein [Sphingobacterium sp. SRCM116780]UIR56072.1 hypothetical protein LZQ00_17635 [Sphingobacterium sp. SRCM116780]
MNKRIAQANHAPCVLQKKHTINEVNLNNQLSYIPIVMKKNNKKLKVKSFRYLNKEDLKNPKLYLDLFYQKITLNHWQEKIYVFLTNGSVQNRYPIHDPFFIHKNLIKHIEIAYVLYEKNILPKEATRLIEYIFEVQCIAYWIEQFDELLKNETDRYYLHDVDNYNPYLINYIELLHHLALYLYLFLQDKEDEFQFPYYILPVDKLTEEELNLGNYHQRVYALKESIVQAPIPFYNKEKVELPEWLAPQPYDISAVRDFFQIDDFEGWRNGLWQWYQSVINADVFWSAHHPDKAFSAASLLHDYACIYALLEMYRSQSITRHSSTYTFEDLHPRSILKEQPSLMIMHEDSIIIMHYVDEGDMEDPLSEIITCVNEYSKVEWDEILYEWLSYGLSSNGVTDERYAKHGTRIYQLLVKIIELSYILAYKDEIARTHTAAKLESTILEM